MLNSEFRGAIQDWTPRLKLFKAIKAEFLLPHKFLPIPGVGQTMSSDEPKLSHRVRKRVREVKRKARPGKEQRSCSTEVMAEEEGRHHWG